METTKTKYRKPKTKRNPTANIQSITVIATSWLDKINGNSYFTAKVLVNGLEKLYLPFQYGYGDHYLDMAAKNLLDAGILPDLETYETTGGNEQLSQYCRRKNINLFHTMQYGLKRELLKPSQNSLIATKF